MRKHVTQLTLAAVVVLFGGCESHPDEHWERELASYELPLSMAQNQGTSGWRRATPEQEPMRAAPAGGMALHWEDLEGMPPFDNWGEDWLIAGVYKWGGRGEYEPEFERIVKKTDRAGLEFEIDDVAHHSIERLTDGAGFFTDSAKTAFKCATPAVCATLARLQTSEDLRATLQLRHPDQRGEPQIVTMAAISYVASGRDKLAPPR